MIIKSYSNLLLYVLLALTVSGVFATEKSQIPDKDGVCEFAPFDGRIDADAMKNTGFQGHQGNIDADIHIAPQTSKPRELILSASVSADSADDVYWDNSLSPNIFTVNGPVFALGVFGTNLIMGGAFSVAGTVSAPEIASFDGTNWSSLGTGMNMSGNVYALSDYATKLIAAGSFTTAGGVSAYPIASWDGANWSALAGNGLSNNVSALTVFQNELVAGGLFSHSGPDLVNYVASWDGANWQSLGMGMEGAFPTDVVFVSALVVYQSKLIAGGRFKFADGLVRNSIAAWDGFNWLPLGSGVHGAVYSLTVYNNMLIAGGNFDSAGVVSANAIAAWDGADWTALGSGIGDPGVSYVYALTVYDNKLIAGGDFTSAGGNSANYIAAWDGANWSPLGTGLTYKVRALATFDNKLYVGGEFTSAGGKPCYYLARWTKQTAVGVGDDNASLLPENFVLEQNYPNPFNPATTINYSVPTRSHVKIEIFNVLGQRVQTLVNETKSAGSYRIKWSGADESGGSVSTGVYLYRLLAGDVVQTKRMLLIK